jgi:hypothetical protein
MTTYTAINVIVCPGPSRIGPELFDVVQVVMPSVAEGNF